MVSLTGTQSGLINNASGVRRAEHAAELPSRAASGPVASYGVPALSIIAPTYNERANIRPLAEAIAKALGDVSWELIIVDDDSPDGTYDEVLRVARDGLPIRVLRRVGRRGLASAVVEGAMSARAEIVGVIDADMQHDETLLPRMLSLLQDTDADLVVASRHIDGGGLGDWNQTRQRMSSFATWSSRFLIGDAVTDPMSGFFMTRRSVFDAAIYDLSQQGYKILLDILTSSPRELKVVEVPYVFRDRQAGESKVDIMIIAEFAFLLIEKLTKGLVPPKFVLFSIVGGLGLGVHLTILEIMRHMGFQFLPSQLAATVVAMAFNYVVNNAVTYRSQSLKGMRFVVGFLLFAAICSLGAVANISVANLTVTEFGSWPLAGIAGAVMSSVFNFGLATRVVWGSRRRNRKPVVVETAVA